MYVAIIGESAPCMPFVILDYTVASSLVWVSSKARRSHRNLRDSTAILCCD